MSVAVVIRFQAPGARVQHRQARVASTPNGAHWSITHRRVQLVENISGATKSYRPRHHERSGDAAQPIPAEDQGVSTDRP